MSQLTFIPQVKISPSRLVFYNSIEGLCRRSSWESNFECNKPEGYISKGAAKRIRTALEWLLHFSPSRMVYYHDLKVMRPFKLSFLTLTLPSKQVHSDNYIKAECLNQFNIELRKKFKTTLFMWKAEAQKNGNIHFHYTINKYIYWRDIQQIWNRIINKLGYVDAYRSEWSNLNFNQYVEKRKLSGQKELAQGRRSFDRATSEGWWQPNTVDVHSVKKVQNLEAYLVKYFLKNADDRRSIEGKLWAISEPLAKFKGAVECICGTISDELAIITERYKSFMRYFAWSGMCKVSIKDILAYLPQSKLIQSFELYVDKICEQYSIVFT
jgi:hypothetical protein